MARRGAHIHSKFLAPCPCALRALFPPTAGQINEGADWVPMLEAPPRRRTGSATARYAPALPPSVRLACATLMISDDMIQLAMQKNAIAIAIAHAVARYL